MRFSSRSAPAALLALAGVSFGLFIPWLGFYWDDWPQLFTARAFGVGSFWAYFASDRPLSAWTHILFSPLLGGSSIAWHLLTLGLRWLASVGAWWTFLGVWSRHPWQAVAAALLFLVYPVYTQQSISVAYHQHWAQYALFMTSLGCMVWSVRPWSYPNWAKRMGMESLPQKAWLFTGLAIACQLLQLAVTEFFTTSELLRPLLLFLLFSNLYPGEPGRKHLLRSLRAWLPYLVVLTAYGLWRLFILKFPGGDPNTPKLLIQLLTQPLAALQTLAQSALWDSLYILAANWANVVQLTLAQTSQPIYLAAWVGGLAAGAALAIYLSRLDDTIQVSSQPLNWAKQAVLVGVAALLLGPAPVWALGGYILNDPDPYHADRYALAAMLGAALLLAALVEWAGKGRVQKAVLLWVVIGLAVGFHLRTANAYRWLWTEQQRFYWQLAWRAPSLKPGTALITESILFPFQGNFATASAVNLLYPQADLPERVNYWVYALRPRFETTSLEAGPKSFNTQLRIFQFTGMTPESLLLVYGGDHQSCLWVLRPEDRDNPHLSQLVKDWLPASNLEQISAEPAGAGYPPVDLFGSEPEPGWCYFFQKAELARQRGDWLEITRLGAQARAQGFEPKRASSNSPREWLPFIEGYTRTGKMEDALVLAHAAVEQDSRYRVMFCPLWRELKQFPPVEWSCGVP